ncbi:MAG: tRNA (adenosine(37)-N6)-dimethylallyltransferase MiaA [Clostridia bacterium]|nr:tRNA (adenosine(37)-N6)-dimethylallyltransferase MiaA [Clostridia bacterium]
MKKKTVVVVGPTASGKTALGIHICKKFNGEVISADSMQIYKGMSVSTAKPSLDEQEGVPHHLIDFLDITEKYSVSAFCKDAKNAFDSIYKRNRLPVVVGGTGLYVDSFLSNTEFLDDASSEAVREHLRAELDKNGIDYMYSRLKNIDPEAAEKIHPNNTVRVLRALEVFQTTGKTITEQARLSHAVETDIEPLFIGITYKDREKLYDRINRRVDLMVKAGLWEEAREFFDSEPSLTALNAIGCKELKPFFDGVKGKEECIECLKRSTRRYAKRQLTWFKRNKEIHWVYPDETQDYLEYVDDLINKFLAGETT